MTGSSGTYDDERVTFIADASHPDRFRPQIASAGSVRPFAPEDMQRVLDFEGIEGPPDDGGLMYCEDGGTDGLRFTVYHFCLRAGYFFYFDVEDVDEESGPYTVYHDAPIGVIPLEKIAVEFPPGGRRVFREHAHTDAKSGYEFVILHVPDDNDMGEVRPPSFIVAESLGQREKWANALRTRASIQKPTLLRAGYSSTSRPSAPTTAASEPVAPKTANEARIDAYAEMKRASTRHTSAAVKKREVKRVEQQVMEVSDDAELAGAVVEFGAAHFNETEWMETFFQTHNDFDAPSKCRQMEQFLSDMKKSLKGAVLEQYEYFVQASGEMTTMGREVTSLKTMIETQVDTIKEMKEIDFTGALKYVGKDEIMGNDEISLPELNGNRSKKDFDEKSMFSDVSSVDPERRSQDIGESSQIEESEADAPRIDVPVWLDDVCEEIVAVTGECRYSEAIDLYWKAKNEITDLLDKHERPTSYRIQKDKYNMLKETQKALQSVEKKLCGRLEETLRRKNEALKQASKRDRGDTHVGSGAIISPCALNDDALYLQLLVRMGKNQEAAEAYSTRRSLLLQETLQEQPMSGAGSVDLVIYAAQLSQSFFSCLANSVEGFLDLFMSPSSTNVGDTMSIDASSLHSQSSKNLSSGALAAIVLWCDSELSKFATAFGGTRILANLALSPPPRDAPKQARVLSGDTAEDTAKERKNAIEVAAQCLDQAFLYASQNLDTVGLPLTPRLAEFLRGRLKGCESEIAELLDEQWQHLTLEWRQVDEFR